MSELVGLASSQKNLPVNFDECLCERFIVVRGVKPCRGENRGGGWKTQVVSKSLRIRFNPVQVKAAKKCDVEWLDTCICFIHGGKHIQVVGKCEVFMFPIVAQNLEVLRAWRINTIGWDAFVGFETYKCAAEGRDSGPSVYFVDNDKGCLTVFRSVQ